MRDRARRKPGPDGGAGAPPPPRAHLVVPQEPFAASYFCQDERVEAFALADELVTSVVVRRFAALARELGVVMPIPFFERAAQSHFNASARRS